MSRSSSRTSGCSWTCCSSSCVVWVSIKQITITWTLLRPVTIQPAILLAVDNQGNPADCVFGAKNHADMVYTYYVPLPKTFLLENLGEILDSQKAAPLLRMLMSSESSSVMKDKFEQKAVLSQGLFSRGMELLLGDKQHSSFSGWICGPPVMRSRQKRCDQRTLSLIIILSVSN